MAETSVDVVKRYLEDAIAAEKNLEEQLQTFANEAALPAAKQLFAEHARETRVQHERLFARLEALGGSAAVQGTRGFVGQLLGLAARAGHIAHQGSHDPAQHLLIAFAAENSELAMYESLAAISEAAGDTDTFDLARAVQSEEKRAAERIWQLIPDDTRVANAALEG